jgi:hypothetical protein
LQRESTIRTGSTAPAVDGADPTGSATAANAEISQDE